MVFVYYAGGSCQDGSCEYGLKEFSSRTEAVRFAEQKKAAYCEVTIFEVTHVLKFADGSIEGAKR